jgi:hypothetical protein
VGHQRDLSVVPGAVHESGRLSAKPLDVNNPREVRTGDEVLAWLARFISAAPTDTVKWLYTLLGFVPVIRS